MIYRIFVNEQELDLNPKTVIALTIQATAIGAGDPNSRLTSFTNQVTVPRSYNNDLALDYSNLIGSSTTFPYSQKLFKIWCNDVQILDGAIVVKSASYTEYNLQFYGLVKGLSLAIGSKVLSDLDFGDSPITWNAAYIDSVRASTTGICAPVLNYGQIENIANSTIGTFYLPSVGYKGIVTQILLEAGYTMSGTFYTSDDFFNRMGMSYSRNDWPGTSFKINEILSSEITQISFIQDFLIRFGGFFRITNTLIEVVTLETMLNDTSNAIDWTEKRVSDQKFNLEFSWTGWSGSNKFTYSTPEGQDIFAVAVTNDGSIQLNNDNLTSSRTVYESIFAPQDAGFSGVSGLISVQSAAVPGSIFGATIRVWDTTPTDYLPFSNDPKPMLFLFRDQGTFTFTPPVGPPIVTTESAIVYDGNSRTDYKVAMFAMTPANGQGDIAYTPELDNLRWRNGFGTANGLLDLYYSTLETKLQMAKKKTDYYDLDEVDIASLDVLVPIFDTDNYYLISKIYDFVPGKNTKVDLLKIS